MKKNILLYGSIIIALLIVLVLIFTNKSNGTLNDTNSMKSGLKTIYKGLSLPELDIKVLKNDNDIKGYTNLENVDDIEAVVASEPLINAQAYLALLIKVKDQANVEKVKEDLYNSIDMNRWICVSADKLYITNNGNTIFLVMSEEDWAKEVYNSFKNYVNNNIGKELEKNN